MWANHKLSSKVTSVTFYHQCSSLDYVTLYGKIDFSDARITDHFTLKKVKPTLIIF